MLELYFLIVFVVIVYIFTITLLRKNKNKLKNCGYLALSLLDIANIFISYNQVAIHLSAQYFEDLILNHKDE